MNRAARSQSDLLVTEPLDVGLAQRVPAQYPICMICSKSLGRPFTIALEGGKEIGDGKVFLVCSPCYKLFCRLEEFRARGLLR